MKRAMLWKPFAVLSAYGGGIGLGVWGAYLARIPVTTQPQQLAADTITNHNLTVLGMMLLGSVTLGLATLGVLFLHGAVLGFAIQSFTTQGQADKLLLAIAPHGIPEIIGFLVAGVGDLYLAVCFLQFFLNPTDLNLPAVKRGLLLNAIAALLLVGAGRIEHTIIPQI